MLEREKRRLLGSDEEQNTHLQNNKGSVDVISRERCVQFTIKGMYTLFQERGVFNLQ